MNTVDDETVLNKSVVYYRSRLCKRLSVREYKMVLFFPNTIVIINVTYSTLNDLLEVTIR